VQTIGYRAVQHEASMITTKNNVYLGAAECFAPAVTLLYFENGIGESK
jgi:hypothetical protein